MTIWVRSQDKTIFKQATRVHYEERNGNHFVLVGMDEYAQYKNKERCLEIIDEIQSLLVRGGTTDDKISALLGGTKAEFIVYEMPKE